MKKFSLSVALTVALAFVGFAQAPAAEGEARAEIFFEKTVHDFGAIAQRSNGTYEFEFTNTGSAPLLLTNANSSCGCTVPNYPKTPIAPGEKGKITVKYDTNRMGGFHKSVTVTSNAKAAPSVVLYIKGSVNAAPAAAPAQ
ncbi:MAG: DUF1573 domain-containing protein [Prevotellaceae bacterium]|jgi:hypothetical protein|nr:DUF1573 domain-containing protein [Prevotellaceae bacterium]